MLGLVVACCLINWYATTILVESHLLKPARDFVVHEAYHVWVRGELRKCGGRHVVIWPEDATQEEYEAAKPFITGPWGKLAQLVTCQMCTRTWVGFAEAFVFGGPFSGLWHQYLSNGLLYAAGGHLILEARSHIAKVEPLPLEREDQLGA